MEFREEQVFKILKDFGKELVFWGGGINTQNILPFGTPETVKD